MNKIISIFLISSSVLLSACSIGPLVSHETARTVGNSQAEFLGGYGSAGYAFKFNYGITKDLDFGLQYETFSLGIRTKYALINGTDKGFSLSIAGGIGTSIGGSHYYGDLTSSYLSGAWEPYGTIRLVHVKNDPLEFRDQDTGHVDFVVDLPDYNYGQAMLGSRFWFDKHWLMSIEVSSLFAMTSGLKIGDGFLVGAALGYHFN